MGTPTALWAIALIGLSCLLSAVAAGRLALRPLSPVELRRALTDAGVDGPELTPLGRATPSAIAGLGGFALGVANGLGGALIFDLLTSNETAAYVSSLINSLNANATDEAGSEGTQQEVCFASRSLSGDRLQGRANGLYDDDDRDIYDYEDDNEDFYSGLGRQVDDYYSSDYEEPSNAGITCIVVNQGRAIFRHRRSTDAELPSEQKDSPSRAEYSQKESDQQETSQTESTQTESVQKEARGTDSESSQAERDQKVASQAESSQLESDQKEASVNDSDQEELEQQRSRQTDSDQAKPTPGELDQAEVGQTESTDVGLDQKGSEQSESDPAESSQTELNQTDSTESSQTESSQTESSQTEGEQTS